MHLIQNHHIRMQTVQFLLLQDRKLGIGHEGDVFRHMRAGGGKAFALGFEDVFRGESHSTDWSGWSSQYLKPMKLLPVSVRWMMQALRLVSSVSSRES